MKKLIVTSILAASALMLFTSCESLLEEEVDLSCDNGWGTLHVSNESLNTVQKILIGNTNYGTLNPGEDKDIVIPKGDYEVELRGVSGGDGCDPSHIIVPDCGKIGYACEH